MAIGQICGRHLQVIRVDDPHVDDIDILVLDQGLVSLQSDFHIEFLGELLRCGKTPSCAGHHPVTFPVSVGQK